MLKSEIKRLRAERDEAKRELVRWQEALKKLKPRTPPYWRAEELMTVAQAKVSRLNTQLGQHA